MELPVLIERLPDSVRYTARLGEPFNLTVEAATADEAQARLAEALRRRLQQGAELRSLSISPATPAVRQGGWLPQDELTQEWLQEAQQFREQSDEADRRRLEEGAGEGESAP